MNIFKTIAKLGSKVVSKVSSKVVKVGSKVATKVSSKVATKVSSKAAAKASTKSIAKVATKATSGIKNKFAKNIANFITTKVAKKASKKAATKAMKKAGTTVATKAVKSAATKAGNKAAQKTGQHLAQKVSIKTIRAAGVAASLPIVGEALGAAFVGFDIAELIANGINITIAKNEVKKIDDELISDVKRGLVVINSISNAFSNNLASLQEAIDNLENAKKEIKKLYYSTKNDNISAINSRIDEITDIKEVMANACAYFSAANDVLTKVFK